MKRVTGTACLFLIFSAFLVSAASCRGDSDPEAVPDASDLDASDADPNVTEPDTIGPDAADSPTLEIAPLLPLLRGYVTTSASNATVNRCAVDPIGDLSSLPANPNYVEAYRSGKSGPVWAPTSPSAGKDHNQGIGRVFIGGLNYFVVSESVKNGTYAGHVLEGGGFEVVEMGSRGGTRGPLRGNVGVGTAPSAADRVVNFTPAHFAGWPHGGGIQISGHFLVLSLEDSHHWYRAGFRTFDLSTPAAPGWPTETPLRSRGQVANAGAVAMTRLATSTGGPGLYLVMVFGNDSDDVEIFVSSSTTLPEHGGSTSRWISLAWTHTPFNFEAYQNVQLVTACDGTLYVVGTHNNGLIPGVGEDWADLWRVDLSNHYMPTFVKVARRHVRCSDSSTHGIRYCNFQAGAGVYITNAGQLCLYGVEHYNDAYPGGGQAVKVREFCR